MVTVSLFWFWYWCYGNSANKRSWIMHCSFLLHSDWALWIQSRQLFGIELIFSAVNLKSANIYSQNLNQWPVNYFIQVLEVKPTLSSSEIKIKWQTKHEGFRIPVQFSRREGAKERVKNKERKQRSKPGNNGKEPEAIIILENNVLILCVHPSSSVTLDRTSWQRASIYVSICLLGILTYANTRTSALTPTNTHSQAHTETAHLRWCLSLQSNF